MNPQEIINLRLSNQLLLSKKFSYPADLVRHMCAMQAQDYLASLWAIGLRTEACIETDIENAIASKEIVRTWPMRGTLHFVAPEDIRWMLKLMTPRILSNQTKRFKKEFDIDEMILNKCRDILIKVLQGGKSLKRNEVYNVLEEEGISATGQRGLHIIWYLAQDGLLCFGLREGKQPSFVLLDEWIPESKQLTPEESLSEIAYRYFQGRGPATLADFIWWTGLSVSQAKIAIELNSSRLLSFSYNDKTYWMTENATSPETPVGLYLLLPSFDEYLIAYSDRSLMLGKFSIKDVVPFSNGMFSPVIVENGLVTGTWKRTLNGKSVKIEYKYLNAKLNFQQNNILEPETKYKRFLSL